MLEVHVKLRWAGVASAGLLALFLPQYLQYCRDKEETVVGDFHSYPSKSLLLLSVSPRSSFSAVIYNKSVWR